MQVSSAIPKLIHRRFDGHPSWVILVEMFIGLGWIRAAVEKIISPEWWDGTVIEKFVADHADRTLAWYGPILDHIVLPNVTAITVLIVVAQLLAGTAILTAERLHQGLFLGMTMNINFIMIGAVDPSIFYLILQASIALWLFEKRAVTAMGLSYLAWIWRLSLVLVVISAPFVRTIDPATVIKDPAMILVTYGLSIGLSSFVALQRLKGKPNWNLANS